MKLIFFLLSIGKVIAGELKAGNSSVNKVLNYSARFSRWKKVWPALYIARIAAKTPDGYL
jgi:hypothetical protein